MINNRKSWLVATGWDDQSLEYVFAHYESKQLTVVAAESHSLKELADRTPGDVLREQMRRHGVRRPSAVVVALPRTSAEIIPISLPPATDDELPDLVAMQIQQLTPELAENEAIDFIPLVRTDAPGREVIAVAPQIGELDSIRDELKKAGLKPQSVGFRPLGLLPLIDRTAARKSDRSLAFCLEPGSADILLLDHGNLVLSRAVRLPKRSDPTFSTSLIGEMRRTAMVLPHDDGTVSELQHVYGFGNGAEFDDLIASLNEDTSVSVTRVNPFRVINDKTEGRQTASRFAPLIGMLLGHTDNSENPTIDFLNPRRAAAAPSQWRRVALYSAIAAAVIGAAAYVVYDTRAELDAEMSELSRQLDEAEKMSDKVGRKQGVVQSIENWQSDDVNWADELRDLSIRFPSADDVLIQRMSITPINRGSMVTLQLRVRDPKVMDLLEANLRDDHHSIVSKRFSQVVGAEQFGWQLDATILINPRPRESYLPYLDLASE